MTHTTKFIHKYTVTQYRKKCRLTRKLNSVSVVWCTKKSYFIRSYAWCKISRAITTFSLPSRIADTFATFAMSFGVSCEFSKTILLKISMTNNSHLLSNTKYPYISVHLCHSGQFKRRVHFCRKITQEVTQMKNKNRRCWINSQDRDRHSYRHSSFVLLRDITNGAQSFFEARLSTA